MSTTRERIRYPRQKAVKRVTYSFTALPDVIRQLDQLVIANRYPNRSAVIEEAIITFLNTHKDTSHVRS